MAKISTDLMEMILRECARAAPQPWYPSAYAQETGLAREELDASLDELRLGGLIRLTDWVQGRGQGYTLTPEGQALLDSPRLLERLRANGVARRPVAPPATRPWRADERPTAWDRGEQVRAALMGRSTPRVTRVLLFLNLLVFAYGCALALRNQIPLNDFIGGTNAAALEISHQTGALRPEDIIVGQEWWRLLTCCFVHFGLLHLGVNMFSLYVIGPLVERMWGSWGYLVLYLVSGLVGSCSMMVFSNFNNGAGASGALWGIMVSVAAWVFLNRNYLPRQLVSAWSRQLLLVFVVNVLISNLPGISAAAHFGGGIAGLAVAVPLHYVRYSRGLLRWLAILGIVAVPMVALAAVQYRIEPFQEQGKAVHIFKLKYLPEIRKALKAELTVYRGAQLAQLLATPMEKRRDDADAAQISSKVRELLKQLKETMNALATSDATQQPVVVELLGIGRAYVQAAGQFYQALEICLDDQQIWTRNKERTLAELNRRLLTSRADAEKIVEELSR
jgi:membrane associated rhomboid family serine protease